MKRDCYEVLGVTRSADDKQLKSAYRKLAKKYHPDVNPGDRDAEQKFKEVGEAYAILSDPEKRKLYDAYGFAAFEGGGPAPGAGGPYEEAGGGSYRSFHFDGRDAEDLFRSMFGDIFSHSDSSGTRTHFGGFGSDGSFRHFSGFDGGFGDFSSFGGMNTPPAEDDLDLRASMNVTFREAALGAVKAIRLKSPGAGKEDISLKVRIPSGVDDGKCVRLKGRGRSAPDGRQGDLLIELHIAPDPQYTRKGLDVYTSAEIPFTTAALGGEATLPTLHGDVNCKIPAGTQSGSKIRLREKGIRRTGRSPSVGDEYVEIRIAVPKTLTAEERCKLEEFEQIHETRGKRPRKAS